MKYRSQRKSESRGSSIKKEVRETKVECGKSFALECKENRVGG